MVVTVGLLAVFAIGAPASAEAQSTIEPAFQADIVKLLEVTGFTKIAEQMGDMVLRRMSEQMRLLRPDIPQRGIDIVGDVVRERLGAALRAPDGFIPMLVPIYAKHFSRDEIRALVAFYESEVGRKAVSVIPSVMQEAAQVGQTWAAKITPEIQAEIEKRLKAEGFIK